MAIHLFSTPIECTNCGTVVDDPTVDKCPNCGALLKERRTPGRLAGVERRYGQIRFLMGFLRFLGIATLLLGVLVFLFSEESVPWSARIAGLLGGLVLAVVMLVGAGIFDVALDIEENTRAAFRVQQQVLAMLQSAAGRAAAPAGPAAGDVARTPDAAPTPTPTPTPRAGA